MAEKKVEFEAYEHHGTVVSVRKDLRGTHWDNCLCKYCGLFRPGTPEKNCVIANAVYANCLAFNLCTPVYECPDFQYGEPCFDDVQTKEENDDGK
jgi:hypothetical protein